MTNALAEAIQLETQGKPSTIQCQACKAIAAISADERKTLHDAIKAGFSLAALTRALRSLGHTIGPESLHKHVRNGHEVEV